MPKFEDLGSKLSKKKKKKGKFKISTSKLGYMQNVFKIRKLILFDLKCPNLGIWARNLKSEANRKFQ